MRQLGAIPDAARAEQFGDYLTVQGIPNQVEPSPKGASVWIRNEDQLAVARAEWERFLANPDDSRYQGHSAAVAALRAEREQRLAEAQERVVTGDRVWGGPEWHQQKVVVGTIVIAILVTVFGSFGERQVVEVHNQDGQLIDRRPGYAPIYEELAFRRPYRIDPADVGSMWVDLQRGQLWRLLTPIFIHFGVVHLVFNCIMMYRLGAPLEQRRGSWWVLAAVIATGVVGNLAQAFATTGIGFFGGLSGVVYGLLGYIWCYNQRFSDLGFTLDTSSYFILIGFMFLGFTGALDQLMGPIANWAHLGGFLTGVAFAYLPRRV